ncbi:MAG: amidohydrolase [Burkholderiaceae bacterium]|nr:amidohydrolase [Burkholderiaceae bacterium]
MSAHIGAAAAGLLGSWAWAGTNEPADTVFMHGDVYTVDAKNSRAQAVAVRDGRIVFVGSDRKAQAFVGASTHVVDLGGRMMMPGLIDGHMHPLGGGEGMLRCNMEYKPFTVAQMQDKIRACIAAMADKGEKEWLQVVNWDRQAMSSIDRDPTLADLDALAAPRPIIVTSIDGHSRLNNSVALAAAGIANSTPNPPGGVIAKDAQGHLTGMLEDGALLFSDKAIPPATEAERLQFARIALDMMRQQGVTSFLSALSNTEEVETFATLSHSGELTARAEFAIKVDPKEAQDPVKAVAAVHDIAARYNESPVDARPAVDVHTIKLWMDGVLQAPAQTAALLAPYLEKTGPAGHSKWHAGAAQGQSYFTRDQVDGLLAEAAKAGIDVHMHAIGDATVRLALDGIADERHRYPELDFRPAIAHAELVDPADYRRFKQLDVTAVMQFQWAERAPYSVDAVEHQLGPQRYARMEPEGSLKGAGTRIAYGSDWPVDQMAYFYNLRVGVTRSGDPAHPAGFGPQYAGRLNQDPLLTRADVIRAATAHAAYQLRLESKVGSIEPGKLADLAVLDRNFMTAPENQLAFTKVLLTMVGGRVVWRSAPFDHLASNP